METVATLWMTDILIMFSIFTALLTAVTLGRPLVKALDVVRYRLQTKF